ncbi:hypothetical protein FHS44_006258 [Streptosporangium saharense]|uniref:Insertion element IS150 protein InsJ-like helix-turn-helix domain-containing protein n=1 Tax=Streptosporangium saharense TaxID=1706840 RepID=A0A7W7VQK3_9ACTN|nr:hypothetical protein [Streptosporangium saharense]
MRPPIVFAKAPATSIEQLHAQLRGPWRPALRAVMVLLSLHGLPAAQIAGLLGYDAATVRRWIGQFNRHGLGGLADRPRLSRPRLGGQHLLGGRIAALLARPGSWTLARLWRYLKAPSGGARCIGGYSWWPCGGAPSWSPAAIRTVAGGGRHHRTVTRAAARSGGLGHR